MQQDRQQLIRSLFDEYIEMYASRDDRLTARFSENFSGYTGGGNFLVTDRSEWVNITRQDFSQVTGRIRIEMLDISMQDVSNEVVVITAFFHIHLPAPPDQILSRETARLVLVFRLEVDNWKIVHSGISIPYNLVQDGEVYPLKGLQERNSQLEAMVAERTRALDSRSNILEMLAKGAPLPNVLKAIIRSVEQGNVEMRCSILLLDNQENHLGNIVAPGLPHFYTSDTSTVEGFEIGVGVGSCGTAAFTGELVVVGNIAPNLSWQSYKEVAARAGLGECWSQPIRSSSGQVLGRLAIYHDHPHMLEKYDISIIEQAVHLASIAIDRTAITEKINSNEALYRLLTEDALDVVWKTDLDFRFTYISPVDERLRGYRADEVIGHHIFEMLTTEGIATVTEIMQRRQAAEQDGIPAGPITFEVQHRCKDGRLLWGEVLSTAERDALGTITGYHGITREITERKQMQDQVRQLAFYDTLTNLPNRRLLSDRLSQAMAATNRSGFYGALIFLDLDNFKPVNDNYGHVVGDLLLIEATARLKSCVREMDTVARFGGDEFIVMLSDLNSDKAKSTSQAEIVAEKIRRALSGPYVLKIKRERNADTTIEHHCSASIGVALFGNNEVSQDDVLKWADAAMYQAKEAGRNTIRFYDSKTE